MGSSPRILLVDDDPVWSRTIVRLLGACGFEAEACATSDEALARVAAEPWSLLLVDYDLGPGPTGADLARDVRARTTPCPPLVLLTGVLYRIDEHDRAPFDAVFSKVVAPARVIGELRTLIAAGEPEPEVAPRRPSSSDEIERV